MMALAKCASNDLSVLVLEYPEIIIPEQGLKKLNWTRIFMLHDEQALQSSSELVWQIVRKLDAPACMILSNIDKL